MLLNRGDVLPNSAVKTVRHIRTVRNLVDDAVFLTELLHLQPSQRLRRSAIDCVKDVVLDLIAMDDERYAVDCRARILRFNDEILHGQKHTKEHFDQALSDITTYNSYCDAHKDFKNQITVHATENILKTYDTCMEEHSFL